MKLNIKSWVVVVALVLGVFFVGYTLSVGEYSPTGMVASVDVVDNSNQDSYKLIQENVASASDIVYDSDTEPGISHEIKSVQGLSPALDEITDAITGLNMKTFNLETRVAALEEVVEIMQVGVVSGLPWNPSNLDFKNTYVSALENFDTDFVIGSLNDYGAGFFLEVDQDSKDDPSVYLVFNKENENLKCYLNVYPSSGSYYILPLYGPIIVGDDVYYYASFDDDANNLDSSFANYPRDTFYDLKGLTDEGVIYGYCDDSKGNQQTFSIDVNQEALYDLVNPPSSNYDEGLAVKIYYHDLKKKLIDVDSIVPLSSQENLCDHQIDALESYLDSDYTNYGCSGGVVDGLGDIAR